jgi:hypothetical protein
LLEVKEKTWKGILAKENFLLQFYLITNNRRLIRHLLKVLEDNTNDSDKKYLHNLKEGWGKASRQAGREREREREREKKKKKKTNPNQNKIKQNKTEKNKISMLTIVMYSAGILNSRS